MKRLIRRTLQTLRTEGFRQTCKLGRQWIVSRGRYLRYEPACKVRAMKPVPAFERADGSPRIAVQVHLFYPELLEETIACTNRIPYTFDCYLSTDTREKAALIRERFARDSRAAKVVVTCFENRGRDIAPLVLQLGPVLERYDYLLHLHTKYSRHGGFGNRWRLYLLRTLLDSPGYIAALLAKMEAEPRIGLVFQRTYRRVKPSLGWKNNRGKSRDFLARMGIADYMVETPQFPAGDMFWGKTAALAPVFRCGLTADDFSAEAGQLDGTLAHCIERCWAIVAASQGYGFSRVHP